MALAEPDSNPGFLQMLFIDLFSGAGGLHLVLKTLNPEPLTHPFGVPSPHERGGVTGKPLLNFLLP